MQDRLKNLTEKLYQEGVESGKKKADEIISDAEGKAKEIIENAKKDAENLKEKAISDAELNRKRILSELKLAGQKSVSQIKQEISSLILKQLFDAPVKEAFTDKEFVQQMIHQVLTAQAEQGEMKLNLSADAKKELESALTAKFKDYLDKGMELSFDEGVASGFKIGPKDNAFSIEYSDESFKNFFQSYLKPLTYKLIFEE